MDTHELSPLRETLAAIAFQPYFDGQDKENEKARLLTVSSLAATIVSLLNAGFGRVVVVGYNDVDKDFAQESFLYLRDALETNSKNAFNNTFPVTEIGPMELGYIQVLNDEVMTRSIDVNMAKGALGVLQRAFKGNLDKNRTLDVLGTATDVSYWKYVFLTELNSVLQTKPWVLSQLKAALDQGLILSPHRLLALPHESDLVGMKDKTKFIPASGNFSNIMNLDVLDGAVCCDEHAGKFKPWEDFFGSCGTFWWECGFRKAGYNHSHFTPYSFMRLQKGTGIVSLAATAHGRRCFPQKHSVCMPPG